VHAAKVQSEKHSQERAAVPKGHAAEQGENPARVQGWVVVDTLLTQLGSNGCHCKPPQSLHEELSDSALEASSNYGSKQQRQQKETLPTHHLR
jgi:hypothetical protein